YDAADCAAIQARTFVETQFLQRIERVLHQPRNAAAIAGCGDDPGVGAASPFNQLVLFVGELTPLWDVMRQGMQERTAELLDPATALLGAFQCETECTFGRRTG